MDNLINGWVDGWLDRQMDGQMGKNECMGEQMKMSRKLFSTYSIGQKNFYIGN